MRTAGCSAFRYEDKSGTCEVGSSLKLVHYQPVGSVEQPVVNVSAFVAGKMINVILNKKKFFFKFSIP